MTCAWVPTQHKRRHIVVPTAWQPNTSRMKSTIAPCTLLAICVVMSLIFYLLALTPRSITSRKQSKFGASAKRHLKKPKKGFNTTQKLTKKRPRETMRARGPLWGGQEPHGLLGDFGNLGEPWSTLTNVGEPTPTANFGLSQSLPGTKRTLEAL